MGTFVAEQRALVGLAFGLTWLVSSGGAGPTPSAVGPSAQATPPAQSARPARPDESRFTPVVLVPPGELDEPMVIAVLPDERVLIIERKGAFKVFDPQSNTTSLIATIPVNTKYYSPSGAVVEAEEGLFGLTIDPHFAQNRWVYMKYADPQVAKHVLARWELRDADNGAGKRTLTLVAASKKVLLENPAQRERCCHTGGGMTWDRQGNLYISVGNNIGGDSGDERPGMAAADNQATTANTNDLRGKILRIHPEPDGTYTIPPGNLFPPGTPRTRPEIYAMGMRNPWRVSIDSRTGYVYWGEVGPTGRAPYDEFNQAREAGFFGFPYFNGPNEPSGTWLDLATGRPLPPQDPQKPVNNSVNNTGLRELPPAQPAFIAYPYEASAKYPELESGAHSAVGGPIYHRSDFKPDAKRPFPPYYENKWIVAEFDRGLLLSVTMNESSEYVSMEKFVPSYRPMEPIDLTFGPEGDLYVLNYGSVWFAKSPDSSVVKIEYNAGNRKPKAVVATSARGGAVPLQVDLSSLGTADPDGDPLKYSWRVTAPGGAPRTYSSASPRVSFTQPGVYTATLTATDPAGASDAASVEIIAGNTPPQITVNASGMNQTFVRPGQPLTYAVTVADREDRDVARDRVVVSIDHVPEGLDLAALGEDRSPVDATTRFGVAKAFMARADCFGCHARDTQSTGPSYVMLTNKYRLDPTTLAVLANKVKLGGSKVWGEAEMPPHPSLTTAEIKSIITYMLSATDPAISAHPLSGTYTPIPADDSGRGRVVVRAVYTDRPVGNLPAQTSVAMKVLRAPLLTPSAADVFENVTLGSRLSRGGGETRDTAVTALRNGYVGYRNLDLTGVQSLMLNASTAGAMAAVGGLIEVRIGGPTGTIIGQGTVAVAAAAPALRGRGAGGQTTAGAGPGRGAGAQAPVAGGAAGRAMTVPPQTQTPIVLTPTSGFHDLYLVFKNDRATSVQPLMTVSGIAVN